MDAHELLETVEQFDSCRTAYLKTQTIPSMGLDAFVKTAETLAAYAKLYGVSVKPFSDVACNWWRCTDTDLGRAVSHFRAELKGKILASCPIDTPPPSPPALSSRDVLVLAYLSDRHPALCTIEDIENNAAQDITQSLSRHTVVEAVRVLISADYACRPKGNRKGATATELGRRIAAQTAR